MTMLPRVGTIEGQLGSAPERVPEVLVMREDNCVMLQCSAHDAEASASHAAPPAPDAPVAHLEQGSRRADALLTHFNEAQTEQALWQEFRDHSVSINNALTGHCGSTGVPQSDFLR
jgi:hypothetical protein